MRLNANIFKRIAFLAVRNVRSAHKLAALPLACLAVVVLGTTQLASAQRFAYIDSEYILKAVPEYRAAQKQIDVLAEQYRKEIEDANAAIQRDYKALKAEEVLLTPELKAAREKEILAKENANRELQKKHFGPTGDLFNKRKELIKPIQDKLYEAVQKLARDRSYDFVFDKSSDLLMMFSNPKFDKSDDVIELMGYVVPEPGADRPQTDFNKPTTPGAPGTTPGTGTPGQTTPSRQDVLNGKGGTLTPGMTPRPPSNPANPGGQNQNEETER
jgi:outer membrane protein